MKLSHLRIVHIKKDDEVCEYCISKSCVLSNEEFPHLAEKISCENDCDYFVVNPLNPVKQWWRLSDFLLEVKLTSIWVISEELQ